jgi:hypothetical protein
MPNSRATCRAVSSIQLAMLSLFPVTASTFSAPSTSVARRARNTESTPPL